ncbi:hypothetical protein DEA06_14945 [Microbacterium sp. Gd 4-13]|uniref:hypothetical protein n=1 Tax=Microbacterium sp. Gd 4-13 TaxID=2173179 RepID=UPI000D57822F|nr:hypothetical protein [Microbacterium sp. Gd 4-13]PVW02704.1 hypothetical protein DEA06_14945 [Microbacterium sp. Gd 4-13]
MISPDAARLGVPLDDLPTLVGQTFGPSSWREDPPSGVISRAGADRAGCKKPPRLLVVAGLERTGSGKADPVTLRARLLQEEA